MKNLYIYPKTDYSKQESANPYVHNLEKALSAHYNIINSDTLRHGSYDLFRHFRADIFFLNWIEDLPRKNYGILQAMAFSIFLFMTRISGKKIVWVLHNIYTHSKKRKFWSRMGFRNMIRFSDLIITHSQGGVEYIEKNWPRYSKKVHYLIHPVIGIGYSKLKCDRQYDILIWGTVYPYKGITDFIRYAKNSPFLNTQKILIIGKCFDENYKTELQSCLSENITYRDEFIEMDGIEELAQKSKFVLFTYNSPSVLSSGSLMDTICMGRPVIGPDRGAFRDLRKLGILSTFREFDEIEQIIREYNYDENKLAEVIEKFCRENSWEKFSDRVEEVINSKLFQK